MCLLDKDLKELAAALPLFLPPTKASAPSESEVTSAGASSAPAPETNVTGKPALAISAWDRVRA